VQAASPSALPAVGSPAGDEAAANRWPPQIKFIVGNEACERFSFYGMVGILTLYISKHLQQGDARATEISHLFKFGVYFLPLFGAWLSDRVLGRYRTILYISLFYCAGHAVLAFSDLTTSIDTKLTLLYAGLMLLAFGGGGIKPCVSAFVGDQFSAAQGHLIQKAYGLFYWSINFGSFFSFLLIPRIAKKGHYGWAFGVPGIAMALATFIFWLGRKHYHHLPPEQTGKGGFWGMLWHAITHQSEKRPGRGFWDACHATYTADQIEGARAASRVARVLVLIPFFWALWDQSNSTWVIQGNKMEHYPLSGIGKFLLGWLAGDEIDAEQMQSMNAILVMIIVPLYAYLVFPLSERLGLRVTTLRRMGVGMFLTAASFVLVALIEQRIDAGQRLSVLWQTWPYLVLTAGEVLVSNTGIEFAFREAPATMRSTLMSFWLLTVAVGNLGVAQLTHLNVRAHRPGGIDELYISGVGQFLLYAALLLVVAFVFVAVAKRYRYRDPSEALAAGDVPDQSRPLPA
jgi:POT family proton-dependent oligopeptide transporter